MRTKVVRWGNSLGLRIPKALAEDARVQEGSTVDLSLEDGALVIRVAAAFTLEDLLDGVTKDNLHTEVDTGGPVGDETW